MDMICNLFIFDHCYAKYFDYTYMDCTFCQGLRFSLRGQRKYLYRLKLQYMQMIGYNVPATLQERIAEQEEELSVLSSTYREDCLAYTHTEADPEPLNGGTT